MPHLVRSATLKWLEVTGAAQPRPFGKVFARRDPKPSYGRRTVWSPGAGDGIPLRFIQLDMEFSKRPPKGNAVLKIHAPKLELEAPLTLARMRRSVPYMPPIVMLLNERRDIVELRCGSEPTNAYASLGDVDLDQRRSIVIQPTMMRDRVFTAECPTVFRKECPVRISADMLEVAPSQ